MCYYVLMYYYICTLHLCGSVTIDTLCSVPELQLTVAYERTMQIESNIIVEVSLVFTLGACTKNRRRKNDNNHYVRKYLFRNNSLF